MPEKGIAYNSALSSIQQRYSFQDITNSPEAQQRGSVAPSFTLGEFEVDGKKHTVNGLEFSPDGFKVTASTTGLADLFIEDFLSFSAQHLGYRVEKISKPALYGSSVIVEAPKDILQIFGLWNDISRELANEFKTAGKIKDVVPFGVRLLVKASESNQPDALFTFEKRAGPEAGDNIYFSQAPLSSEAHVRFLLKIASMHPLQ